MKTYNFSKLTEIKALEACRDLWRWLEENPSKEKHQWPAFENSTKKCLSYCPCCQYVRTVDKMPLFCAEDTIPESETDRKRQRKLCPLRDLWPKGCCSARSPFRRWNESRYHLRSKYAKQIADFCEKRLKEIEDNETSPN